MYNIIEKDEIGLLREHLLSEDQYARTLCGLDRQAWPDVVQDYQKEDRPMPWPRVMVCKECQRLEPVGSVEGRHTWVKLGGHYRPFHFANARRELERQGMSREELAGLELTIARYNQLRNSGRAALFNYDEVTNYTTQAASVSAVACPGCGGLVRSDTALVWVCIQCNSQFTDQYIAQYQNASRVQRMVIDFQAQVARREQAYARAASLADALRVEWDRR